MLVVLVVVAVVIVGAVAVVAMGRGGEMAMFTADVAPLAADIETATDVALLRPPGSMWGYSKRATDEALNAVARTVTDRDIEIAALRQRLADLQAPAQREPAPGPPAGAADVPGQPGSCTGTWSAWERSASAQPADPREHSASAQPPDQGQQEESG